MVPLLPWGALRFPSMAAKSRDPVMVQVVALVLVPVPADDPLP